MEILSKIGFDWQVAIANLVNFLIIFFILKKLVFKPISRVLEERKKTIALGVEKSLLAEEALIEAHKEKDRLISEAKQEVNNFRIQSEKELSLLKEKRKDEAKQEAEKILKEGLEKLSNEKNIAEKELKDKTINLAMLGAEKILREKMDGDTNKKRVDEILKTIDLK